MSQQQQIRTNNDESEPLPQQQNIGFSNKQPTLTQQLTWDEALALLPPLPDSMKITHTLYNSTPSCKACGGRYYEESVFDIPVIGKLSWKIDFIMPSCCCSQMGRLQLERLLNIFPKRPPPKLQIEKDQPSIQCCGCSCDNIHYFGGTSYFLENELINFELSHYGRLYIQGVLMLEFQQCEKALADILFASENSTMPQMLVYQPHHRSNYKIHFKAEKNRCPEHPYSLRGYWSCCDCKKLERRFEITGLSQGDCQIINTRTEKQACYKTCGCKDSCNCDSCRYADYPDYQINFNNVTKIDKLAIIMCLLHFMMYNEWEYTDYQGIQLKSQIFRAQRLAIQQEKNQSFCSIF